MIEGDWAGWFWLVFDVLFALGFIAIAVTFIGWLKKIDKEHDDA